jgi:hypothetical protein
MVQAYIAGVGDLGAVCAAAIVPRLLLIVRGDELRIYLLSTEALPLRKTWKKFAESTFSPPLISLLTAAHTAMRLRGSSGSPFHADLLKSDEKAMLYAHLTCAV